MGAFLLDVIARPEDPQDETEHDDEDHGSQTDEADHECQKLEKDVPVVHVHDSAVTAEVLDDDDDQPEPSRQKGQDDVEQQV